MDYIGQYIKAQKEYSITIISTLIHGLELLFSNRKELAKYSESDKLEIGSCDRYIWSVLEDNKESHIHFIDQNIEFKIEIIEPLKMSNIVINESVSVSYRKYNYDNFKWNTDWNEMVNFSLGLDFAEENNFTTKDNIIVLYKEFNALMWQLTLLEQMIEEIT